MQVCNCPRTMRWCLHGRSLMLAHRTASGQAGRVQVGRFDTMRAALSTLPAPYPLLTPPLRHPQQLNDTLTRPHVTLGCVACMGHGGAPDGLMPADGRDACTGRHLVGGAQVLSTLCAAQPRATGTCLAAAAGSEGGGREAGKPGGGRALVPCSLSGREGAKAGARLPRAVQGETGCVRVGGAAVCVRARASVRGAAA